MNARSPITPNLCHTLCNKATLLIYRTICFTLWKEIIAIIVIQMIFCFLILCSCHFSAAQLHPRVLCKQSKNNLFHPTAAGTEQLNLIIVCKENISNDDILCQLVFITDAISMCHTNAVLSSHFKILIYLCGSNILLVQNTCCKIHGHQIFLWAKNKLLLSDMVSW